MSWAPIPEIYCPQMKNRFNPFYILALELEITYWYNIEHPRPVHYLLLSLSSCPDPHPRPVHYLPLSLSSWPDPHPRPVHYLPLSLSSSPDTHPRPVHYLPLSLSPHGQIHTPDLFTIYHDQVAAAKDAHNSGPLTFSDFGDPNFDPRRTFVHMFEFLNRLEILGFRKFNFRKNLFGSFKSNITGLERSCCYELHYINSHFLSDNFTVVHTKDDKIFH